jgi:Family of unknown function (DUF6049)
VPDANGNTIRGVRSLLRVAVSAAFAIAATAVLAAIPAATSSAHAQSRSAQSRSTRVEITQGGVTLAIDSVTPQYARPDSTIVVSGTVTNGTGTALAGLSVQLYSWDQPFEARSEMDSYVTGSATGLGLTEEGTPFLFSGEVKPGGTGTWRAEFTAAGAGLQDFGVYPLEAMVTDLAGSPVATPDRTLLPFWPGTSAGISKLKVAWIWPLIDQPHVQACPALTSNDLAASVAGGRLDSLLAAGTANPDADVTWAIDPALLQDLSTMTRPYQVGGSAVDCEGGKPEPASTAAGTWLQTLKTDTASQPAVITPYANVDMAALVHQDMPGDIASAYHLGEAVAGRVLARTFSQNLALPAGGLADQSVLATLAATEHVTSVVLNSKEMLPVETDAPDEAVTSTTTMAGTSMTVLLADNTLTGLLKQASGNLSAGARFAVEQQYLAETAMIAAEFPDSSRSVVVDPPETWAPSLGLASALLHETTSVPWLQPTTLTSLTTAHDSYRDLKRIPPPVSSHSSRELGSSYLAQVNQIDAKLGPYTSMIYQDPAYTAQLDEALAATESSAWRNGGTAQAQGSQLTSDLMQYLVSAEKKVKIIASPVVTMAGASGTLPVTVQNGLSQNIRVTISATVPTALDVNATTLVVGQQKPITVAHNSNSSLIKLSVRSAPQGSTTIKLQLTGADGTALPFKFQLTVHSTRAGQAILLVIAAAIGLLLLSSVFRSGRRRQGDDGDGDGHGGDSDGHGDAEPDEGDGEAEPGGEHDLDSPGNVMIGEPDLTEAPDDLADARRWADDT